MKEIQIEIVEFIFRTSLFFDKWRNFGIGDI